MQLWEKLRKKPLERISVKEICTLAKINRTTFYNHYTDKYELFEKSITYMMQVLDDEIGRLPDESGYNASLNIFRLVRQYHFLFEHKSKYRTKRNRLEIALAVFSRFLIVFNL